MTRKQADEIIFQLRFISAEIAITAGILIGLGIVK